MSGAVPRSLKSLANGVGLALALVPAVTCWLEGRLHRREEAFRFWAQLFAILPGLPGDYLRRAFYRLTLRRCSASCSIGFLSQFTHRAAEVGEEVYVGVGALIGTATLGDRCLIGSRVSILSGGAQHAFDERGRLTPSDPETFERVHLGADSWIGEGAILMAGVGPHCIVSAGAVVSQPIPDDCIVAGNPCRFVGKTTPEEEAEPAPGL